jgi:hypothetical protein
MKLAQLTLVETKQQDAPYPKNTRVRGWKFVLDHERINQSDTWALAPPDMRPWLLMLWHTAWQQVPAGSFSDDDRVIAAKIGMDHRIFVAHKDILMRGWERYSDGRLYHPVLVEQVLNYAEHNQKERQRVAEWRSKQKQTLSENDTRNKHVSTTPEPEPEPFYTGTNVPVGDFSDADAPKKITRHRVPFAEIVDLYHSILPMCPRVEKLTETRKGYIRQRWLNDLTDLEQWENYFHYVAKSKFLTGRAEGRNGKPPFLADIQWLTNPTNYTKIAEEKYHRG